MGDEEKGTNSVGDEALNVSSGVSVQDGLNDSSDVHVWDPLKGATVLGPIENVNKLGMEAGCLVDWAHVERYQEPIITYSMSCGCVPEWTKNFTCKTIFTWFRENVHEFMVGITIALTMVRNEISPNKTPT